jgi:hypothetical protein
MKSLIGKNTKIFGETHVIENPDRKDNFMIDKTAYMAKITELLKD